MNSPRDAHVDSKPLGKGCMLQMCVAALLLAGLMVLFRGYAIKGTCLEKGGLPLSDQFEFQEAGNCLRTGRYSQAMELLAPVLQRDPYNSYANELMGDVQVQMEQWDAAIAHYQKALRRGLNRETLGAKITCVQELSHSNMAAATHDVEVSRERNCSHEPPHSSR